MKVGNIMQHTKVIKEINEEIVEIRGKKLKVKIWNCYYEGTNEYYYDRDLELKNDKIIFDTYKESENLLTSSEIINIRNKYSLSQSTFAKLLGLGEKTITRYENGTIQDKSIDLLIKMIDRDINNFIIAFNENKIKLNNSECKKIEDLIELYFINDKEYNISNDKYITDIKKDTFYNEIEVVIKKSKSKIFNIQKDNKYETSISEERSDLDEYPQVQ